MRNDGDRKKQHSESSPSINKESDNWGVDWIEMCRKIRDDEPRAVNMKCEKKLKEVE